MSTPTFFEKLFSLGGGEGCARIEWIGGEYDVVGIDPKSLRIRARMWNDECGKFYPTIYVTLPVAARLLLREKFVNVGLSNFPYITLELVRLKSVCMDEARSYLEEEMQFLKIL